MKEERDKVIERAAPIIERAFNISFPEIAEGSRDRNTTDARHVLQYILHVHADMTPWEIADITGVASDTAVLYGLNKIHGAFSSSSIWALRCRSAVMDFQFFE